jgi:uncharacterized protein
MSHYLDTSALVKLFSTEPGSEKIKELVNNPENEIWVLELALIELLSAVFRKYRNNEIDERKLSQIQKAIESQIDMFNVVMLANDIVKESKTLIQQYGKVYGLRTLDAIHIAGWMIVAEPGWTFVSSDKNQLQVVSHMNFTYLGI